MVVIAKVKNIWSSDIRVPLEAFVPANPSNFSMWLNVDIGSADSDGADYFTLFICTPEWLMDNLSNENGFLWGRMLIVENFIGKKVKEIIEKKINYMQGNDWDNLAEKLSKYAEWQFEDYVPSSKK